MNTFLKRFIWVIVLAPVVYLAFAWSSLPDKVPMHFNLSGTPDRFGNKKELFGLSAIMVGMSVFVYFLLNNVYRIDPKKNAAENKDRLRRISYAVLVMLAAVHALVIYSVSKGSMQFSVSYILAAAGFLFAVIGNYMPHMKPNYFAGFRLPWTLENEDNWRKTHVLGGKLWFAGGLLIGILCLFLPPLGALIIFFPVMVAITIIPIVYSYRLYKHQKKTEAS